MYDRNIGRFLIVGFVIFLIFIFIIIRIFSGGGDEETKNPSPSPTVTVKTLPDYADTFAEVSLTTEGEVVGNNEHQAVRVTVDKFQRTLTILTGYDGNVLDEHKYKNTEDAYAVFLRAIYFQGFTKKNNLNVSKDYRGQCPLGNTYIFELNDSGDVISNLWASTCGSRVGNFGGNTGTINQLFENQIPEYNQILSDADVTL